MNIKIQNTSKAIETRTYWPEEETKQVLADNFAETQVEAYKAAADFMEKHPQFVEVTFSTELSENEDEEVQE